MLPSGDESSVDFSSANRVFSQLGVEPSSSDTRCSDAAWSLLDGYIRHRLSDGTIMVPDSRGRWHCVRTSNTQQLTAAAALREGTNGVAEVSVGLVEAIERAAIGLWCTSRFMPEIGNGERLVEVPFADAIPLGMERVALDYLTGPDRMAVEQRLGIFESLAVGLHTSRRAAALAMAQVSAQWAVAHELGHLVLGHHLIAPDTLPAPDVLTIGAGEIDVEDSLLNYALEILADRFARMLMMRLSLTSAQSALMAPGVALVLVLFEAPRILGPGRVNDNTHPPKWYRVKLLYEAMFGPIERRWSGRLLASMTEALGLWAEWLGPALNDDTDLIGEALASSAMAQLERVPMLPNLGATLIADADGLSTDALSMAPKM